MDIISNTSTKLITTDQVKTASQTVKTYVDTNHALPAYVTISGTQVTMPQFLKLLSKTIINIENYFDASVTLDSVNSPTGISENITSGTILSSEFIDMATKVKSYIDSNARAPGNLTDTSIGDMIRYESLVYMFSKVMTGYNATDVAPDSVSVIPWLSLSNPNGVFNFRTQEVFTSVQAAIDDAIAGDTIWLRKALYSGNIVLNKRLTIRAVGDFNVTIQALNPALPIITINSGGSGSTIQDLILKGGLNAVGIFINSSNKNEMLGCNITNVTNGVRIYNSTDNIISGCNIYNNSANGILISLGGGNEVSGNKIRQNTLAGIRIENSNKNRIYSNSLTDNQDGISLTNSDAEVHLNQIALNGRYGIYNTGNGTINATNNWWGRNSPTVSSTSPSDIYVAGGSVNYNPRLVLTLNSQTDRSNRTATNYKYKITAGLTHNSNGADTSSDGNIPDDIPVYFNTSFGTLNSTASTRKGRAELVLNSTSAGTANISVTLDNQSASKSVSVTAISVLGVMNTRTGEKFSSIQEAVDDADTRDGDTITLDGGYYRENVAVTKRLIIKPVTGANVTVEAKDDDKSVFVITNEGSGSTIQGFDIISSLDSYGISTSHSYGNKIVNNTVSGSNRGIYLYFSGDNNVTGNTVKDSFYGIVLYESDSNTINGNTVKYNEDGIYLLNSHYNTIIGNTINSNYYGAYVYYSNLNEFTGNNVTGNWVGIYLYDTTVNNVTGNSFTDNGVGVTYINSIGTVLSGNTFSGNYLTDSSSVDTGEEVMASTIYSCGPAALATILKALGIYTTEAELAELAKTDESGTSLWNLKLAAESKGISAAGVRLTSDELQENYLVVLDIDGTNHFEVIKSINSTMVVLFDPNLGIIEMTRAKFDELYTGVAMIFGESAPVNATLLTQAEMEEIKANGYWTSVKHSYWIPGYWYYTYYTVRYSVPVPYIYNVWVPGYKLWGVIPIPGHYEPRIGIRWFTRSYRIPIPHYVPPRKVTYYTYHYVEVKTNWKTYNARTKFVVGVGLFVGGIGVAPPTGGTSLGLTASGVGMLFWDAADNYNELFNRKPETEVYVDGKLRGSSYYGQWTFFDVNGKQSYPSDPMNSFYQNH